MLSKKIETETKKLFSKIHLDQLNENKIFNRLKILLNTDFSQECLIFLQRKNEE